MQGKSSHVTSHPTHLQQHPAFPPLGPVMSLAGATRQLKIKVCLHLENAKIMHRTGLFLHQKQPEDAICLHCLQEIVFRLTVLAEPCTAMRGA